jgi:hypothetical protein
MFLQSTVRDVRSVISYFMYSFLCVYLQRHDEARLCSGTRSNSGASGGLASPYVILMAASWEEADGFV